MSKTLLSFLTEERQWAIRSGCSWQKSNIEPIALVALVRRATWAICSGHSGQKSYMNDSLMIPANRSQKRAIRSKKSYKHCVFLISFLTVFPLFMPMRKSLPSLLTQSLFFKSNMSDSITSLFTKERPWAICSGCSWQKSAGSNLLFFSSASLFRSQKANESLEKPMSEFPTLLATGFGVQKRQTLVFG